MNTQKMELLVARLFRPRQNLIIPNVHWGFSIHECDLLVVSSSGFLTEVEIKISKSDLAKDSEKKHGHNDRRIKNLYFAIPEKLLDCVDLIPERAGIICVYPTIKISASKEIPWDTMRWEKAKIIRKAATNKNAKPISDDEKYQLARLGALRIWGLKEKLIEKEGSK